VFKMFMVLNINPLSDSYAPWMILRSLSLTPPHVNNPPVHRHLLSYGLVPIQGPSKGNVRIYKALAIANFINREPLITGSGGYRPKGS
jgi:hypothetical protein